MQIHKIELFGSTLVGLSLFFGLFFGLNYPEVVRRRDYIHSRCALFSKKIVPRYECVTHCNQCKEASSSLQTCSALKKSNNALDPNSCMPNQSQMCPAVGLCGNGYYCCNECCQTCTTCTTTCSGNPPVCTTTCYPYVCNCFCCSSVSNRLCQLSCPINYSVHEKYKYDDPNDKNRQLESDDVITDFRDDLPNANQYVLDHTLDSTTKCFLNPSRLTEVRFDLQYTTWKWVITTLFGIIPSIVFLGIGFAMIWKSVYPELLDFVENRQRKQYANDPPPPYQ